MRLGDIRTDTRRGGCAKVVTCSGTISTHTHYRTLRDAPSSTCQALRWHRVTVPLSASGFSTRQVNRPPTWPQTGPIKSLGCVLVLCASHQVHVHIAGPLVAVRRSAGAPSRTPIRPSLHSLSPSSLCSLCFPPFVSPKSLPFYPELPLSSRDLAT